jgi:hypothetical protein
MMRVANGDISNLFHGMGIVVSDEGTERIITSVAYESVLQVLVVGVVEHFEKHLLVISAKETAAGPSLDAILNDDHRSKRVISPIHNVTEEVNQRASTITFCMVADKIDQAREEVGATVNVPDRIDCRIVHGIS